MTSNSKTVAAHTSPKSSRASTLSRHAGRNTSATSSDPTADHNWPHSANSILFTHPLGIAPSQGAFLTIQTCEDHNLRSHARIAARLEQWAAQDLLYVRGIGWHYWDGKRWAVDHDNVHAHRILKDILETSWTEAMGNKDLQADVNSAMTSYGARGVLDLTKNYLYTAEVDTDPYLLNCENGTLDLHTMELRPHNSMDCITKLSNAA